MKKYMQFSLKNEFRQPLLIVARILKKYNISGELLKSQNPGNSFFSTSLNYGHQLFSSLNSNGIWNNKRGSNLREHFFSRGRQL